jgi:hypothetical protein
MSKSRERRDTLTDENTELFTLILNLFRLPTHGSPVFSYDRLSRGKDGADKAPNRPMVDLYDAVRMSFTLSLSFINGNTYLKIQNKEKGGSRRMDDSQDEVCNRSRIVSHFNIANITVVIYIFVENGTANR